MMRYKLVILFALLILVNSCSTTLELKTASEQSWFGGAAGSGWGKYYEVSLLQKGIIRIDSIWKGDREKGKMMDFKMQYGEGEVCKNHTTDKSQHEINLKFEERFAGKWKGPDGNLPKDFPMTRPAPQDLPLEYSNGILIWYQSANKKSRHLLIDSLTIKEGLAYP